MTVQMALLASAIHEAKPGFASGDDLDEGVFQIRMNNITRDGALDLTKKRRVRLEGKRSDDLLVEVGDVMFNVTNSPDLVGKSAYIGSLSEPTTFSNHFIRLRTNPEKLDGSYLARWLHTQFQSGRFKGLCRQWVNQATVSREALLGLEVPLLPLPEQRRIAAIFDQADTLRIKRREALTQLDELQRAIFFEMFGDPVSNSKNFLLVKLGEATVFENGDRSSNYPSGDDIKESGVLFLSTKNISRHQLDLTACSFISEDKFTALSRGKARNGDLLITLRGTLGSCCIFDCAYEKAFINAQMMIIRPKTQLHSQYLHSLLTTQQFKNLFSRIGQGAAVPQLTATQLGQLLIPVPAIEEQYRFASKFQSVAARKHEQENQLSGLNDLFSSIQHRAFRGEL